MGHLIHGSMVVRALFGTDVGRVTRLRMATAPATSSASTIAANLADMPSIDGSEIVLGIPIDDRGLKRISRRVITLATIGASFYICNFNVNLIRGNYSDTGGQDGNSLWAAVSSLLIELSIPACGYCGAVYNNRQLTCCFCSCNLFIAIVSIMSFVRLHIRTSEIDGDCEREQNANQRSTCEVWTSNGMEKYVMISSTVLIVSIGCLAFWFGNSLYNRLAHDSALGHPPIPLVGEVIALTTARAASTQPGEAAEVVTAAAPPDLPAQTSQGSHEQAVPDPPVDTGLVEGPFNVVPIEAEQNERIEVQALGTRPARALMNVQPRPAPGDDTPVSEYA